MAYVATKLRTEFQIVSIIAILYLEYSAELDFKGEAHDFWEFVCVDKGMVEVQADGASHVLRQGDIIFHKPWEFHTIKSYNGSAPSLVIISFESPSESMRLFENKVLRISHEEKILFSNIVSEARIAFSSPLNTPSVEEVVRAEAQLIGCEQLIRIGLEHLLIRLARQMLLQDASVSAGGITLSHKTGNRELDKICDYLEQHVYRSLSVQEICNDNMIGRSRLQELFHNNLSCGVMQYFAKLKIERAKEIIRTGQKSLSQISDELCFSSQMHFTKAFKSLTGMSPSVYAISIKGFSESAISRNPPHRELLRRD